MLVRVEIILRSSAGFENSVLPMEVLVAIRVFPFLMKMSVCLALRMNYTDRVLVDGRGLRRVGAP